MAWPLWPRFATGRQEPIERVRVDEPIATEAKALQDTFAKELGEIGLAETGALGSLGCRCMKKRP